MFFRIHIQEFICYQRNRFVTYFLLGPIFIYLIRCQGNRYVASWVLSRRLCVFSLFAKSINVNENRPFKFGVRTRRCFFPSKPPQKTKSIELITRGQSILQSTFLMAGYYFIWDHCAHKCKITGTHWVHPFLNIFTGKISTIQARAMLRKCSPSAPWCLKPYHPQSLQGSRSPI